MACSLDFIEFVCRQIETVGTIRYRKMFGDYMIYANEKPVIIACDNIAFVKQHEAIEALMAEAEKGYPYEGAKEHYILDVSERTTQQRLLQSWLRCYPILRSERRRNERQSIAQQRMNIHKLLNV